MKHSYNQKTARLLFVWQWLSIILLFTMASCKKFVETENPKTEIGKSQVFTSDDLLKTAVNGMYSRMGNSDTYTGGDFYSMTLAGGVAADEMIDYGLFSSFAAATLLPKDGVLGFFWSGPYKDIYNANAIIEGLQTSKNITLSLKNQAMGEALVVRAFSYFYLVNMFGDVPLITTTDYRKNSNIPRTATADVYKQLVEDLADAETLMASDYAFVGNERVRPNKWVATALLARIYLYMGEWQKAEEAATKVIDNTALYNLTSIDSAFLKNNKGALWQWGRANNNTSEAKNFEPSDFGPFLGSLNPAMVQRFDPSDKRLTNWIVGLDAIDGVTYYYPQKYKAAESTPITEYYTFMRLAEQYLVRAEARAHLGLFTGANSAASDIDAIRSRAGLTGTDAANETELLMAIENERLFELFAEFGHRWFDLKRTNRADAVLGPIKPGWESFKQLWPIPQAQIDSDPAMAGQQNEGYH